MEREPVSRILLILLLITLLTSVFDLSSNSGIALTSPEEMIFVDPPSIVDPGLTSGSTFTVNINVSEVVDLYGWQIMIEWDSSILNLTTITFGDFLADQPGGTLQNQYVDQEAGFAGLGETSRGEVPGVDGSGWLVAVEFLVEVDEGETILDISGGDLQLTFYTKSTAPAIPVYPTIESGYFSNMGPPPEILLFVDPPAVTAIPGESFTVNISVADVTDLYLWRFMLGWQTGLLEVAVEDITEGPFLRQGGLTGFAKEVHSDYINVACSLLFAGPGVSGNGTLATVTFKVLGTGNSTLNLYNTTLLDSNLTEIPHTLLHGYFCAPPPIISVATYKDVYAPGEIIVVVLTIENPIDVMYPSSRLTVNITWPSGDGMRIFESKTFTLPGKFNRTVTGSLPIPDSILISEGTYVFTATLAYDGDTATGTATFEIRR